MAEKLVLSLSVQISIFVTHFARKVFTRLYDFREKLGIRFEEAEKLSAVQPSTVSRFFMIYDRT